MPRIARSELDSVERESVDALTEETGYLPVALEQAGVYIARSGVRFAITSAQSGRR